MFDKKAFSNILNKIINKYDSITDFADVSTVGRSYISKYIHMKIDAPPSPKVLEKIAASSKAVTTYEELMQICGYINIENTFTKIQNSLSKIDTNFLSIPLFISEDGKLYKTKQDVMLPIKWDGDHSYFAYTANDDSMAPLLNTDDIAIIEQQEINDFENGKTYLLEIENKILIRKIIDTGNSVELHAMNPYYPVIKTVKNKIIIMGKVIKAEIESAFK